MFHGVAQACDVVRQRGVNGRIFIPWTPVLVRVLEAVEVSVPSGRRARSHVPRVFRLVKKGECPYVSTGRRHHAFRCIVYGITAFVTSTGPLEKARVSLGGEQGVVEDRHCASRFTHRRTCILMEGRYVPNGKSPYQTERETQERRKRDARETHER